MITYEYMCPSCGFEFEQMRSISESSESEVKCPNCDNPAQRHFRTAPSIDTYFEGSFKQENPVHGI